MSDSGWEAAIGCLAQVLAIIVWLPFAFVLQWAWNEAMPHAFGLPSLDYWQALALGVLSTLVVPSKVYLVRR